MKREELARKLHEYYVEGANEAGWKMERVPFEDMDEEEQTVMFTMADRVEEELL